MSDQREPFGKRRRSAEPPNRKSERSKSAGDSSSITDPRPEVRDRSIQAVSDLLASKKDVFNRPSTQPPPPLPDLPGSLGPTARRLTDSPEVRAKLDLATISLEPPHVKLPDEGKPNRTDPGESAPGDPLASQASAGSRLEVAGSNPNPSIRESPTSMTVGPKQVDPKQIGPPAYHSRKDGEISGSGLSLPNRHQFEPTKSTDGVRPAEISLASRPEPMPRTDPSQIEIGAKGGLASATVANPTTSATDRLRDHGSSTNPADLRGTSKEAGSTSGIGEFGGTRAGRALDASATSVRNPLSADSRSFAMASSAGSETASLGPDFGASGSGSAEASAGMSHPGTEGGSIDLSKTNELLQQLVEAVRKQRSSSLPVGGPSVYADR